MSLFPKPTEAALSLLLLSLSGCETLSYLARQGVGQLQVLRSRRHVLDVLEDDTVPPEHRKRLRLALSARKFGIEVLGLRGDSEFTRYVDPGGPVAYNLSAAYQDRLLPRIWRFPLIGKVPYLGFFHKHEAIAEAERLKKNGFDVYIRPVEAYSTLGFLISPIYAGMIDAPGPRGEVRTVEVILHEMAHATAWIPGGTDLNESYATMVGVRGAALFFKVQGQSGAFQEEADGPAQKHFTSLLQGSARKNSVDEEARARKFSTWLRKTLQHLDTFYKEAASERLPKEEFLHKRKERFLAIQKDYLENFPGPRYSILAKGPINNAVLLSFGVYHLGDTTPEQKKDKDGKKRLSGSRLQEALLDSVEGDLGEFVALYRKAAERRDGAAWLRTLAREHLAAFGAKNDRAK